MFYFRIKENYFIPKIKWKNRALDQSLKLERERERDRVETVS